MTYSRATASFASFLLTSFREKDEILAGWVIRGEVCRREEILGVIGKGMLTCEGSMSAICIDKYANGTTYLLRLECSALRS